MFAGQREDPFFISLGRVFDTINLTGAGLGNMGGGVDDLAGYAVHSTVLQLPEEAVTRDGMAVSGPKAGNAVVGVWSTTERRSVDLDGNGSGEWRQVSRLGNPLINEVVVPRGAKDMFNRTTPDQDAANYGAGALEPELAKVLNALFPDVKAPEKDRTDIVPGGAPGHSGPQRLPGRGRPERHRHAEDQPRRGAGGQAEPAGVLEGDNAGYPNGRRCGRGEEAGGGDLG